MASQIQSFASPLTPDLGGLGVSNNAASTVTISGSFSLTLTISGTTSVTLPTGGTILSSAAAVTVAQGGTGATTLTGILKGNGTSAVTAIALPSVATQFLNGTGAFSTPVSSLIAVSGAGWDVIPSAAGAGGTFAAANGSLSSYTQIIASTAAAIYLYGFTLEDTSVTQSLYLYVQFATGGAGSETVIATYRIVAFASTNSATQFVFPLPIAIPTSTRIAVRGQDNQASTYNISLIVVNQSNVA